MRKRCKIKWYMAVRWEIHIVVSIAFCRSVILTEAVAVFINSVVTSTHDIKRRTSLLRSVLSSNGTGIRSDEDDIEGHCVLYL